MGLTERSFLERMELMGLTESRAVTKADRIRSMTDEEQARLFLAHDEQLYRHCPSDKHAEDCYADLGRACDACEKCWLDWLKSPVDKEADE